MVSRNLLLLLLLALVATCYGQSMARPGTLGAKIGGVAKPAAKDTPVDAGVKEPPQPEEQDTAEPEPAAEAADAIETPAETVEPTKVTEKVAPRPDFDAAAEKAAAAAQTLEERRAADEALKVDARMKGRERVRPAELGVGASTREAIDKVVALGEQHAAGDGKHAATGEFRTNPAALKAAEKAKARAREAKSWVDEKLTQSKTMREGLEGLSERSREQFKRQTEEYRNVVKSHKQTKEGLKARLTGPGAPASGDDHSEELR